MFILKKNRTVSSVESLIYRTLISTPTYCFTFLISPSRYLSHSCSSSTSWRPPSLCTLNPKLKISYSLTSWYTVNCSFYISFLIFLPSLLHIFSLLFMSLKKNKKVVGSSLIFPFKYTSISTRPFLPFLLLSR